MAEARRLTQLAAAVGRAADLPDGPLVVALSGGADSAALLWLSVHRGHDVRAIHVHHGLPASDQMEQAARGIATQLDVDLDVKRVEVPPGASPEAQARGVRYAALDAGAREEEWILTAHTSDDQAETVLDHLLRGSGLDGLAGIPARRLPYARPFLGVSRAQTRELATLAGLPWQDDPANAEPGPRRNQLRTKLLPQLEAEYNPRLRPALAATAAHAAADISFLEAVVRSVTITQTATGAEMAASTLFALETPLAARLARRLLAAAGTMSASSGAVDGVLAVAAGAVSSQQVAGGLTIRRRAALVVVEKPNQAAPPDPVPLAVPGSTRFGEWFFDATVSDRGPVAAPLGAAWMMADAATVGPLVVEPAALHPEIASHLAAAGIGAPDRPAHPVLVGQDGPVWVPLARRLAGGGWVDGSTGRYLVVVTRVDRECHR